MYVGIINVVAAFAATTFFGCDKMGHGKKERESCCSSFPDMITAASVVAIGLTEGRRNIEVETLLNFIGLLECNLKFILAQRLIDDRHRIDLDLDLGD